MKKLSILLMSVLLLFVSCDDPNENNMFPTIDEYPASSWLNKHPEKFSQWTNLLRYTSLYNTLNLNENYTIFVPTDSAVSTYLKKNNYGSIESIPLEEAILLVKYHTIRKKVYTQAEFSSGMIPDTTATGDYLSIEFREGGLDDIYVNGEARIEQLDIMVTNGVIHSLGNVLTPITETVWDRINNDGDYSIMAEAIRLSGYAERLSKVSEGWLKTNYTLFAVPDNVYKREGINSIADLQNKYPGDELIKYIEYHLFDQRIDYDALATFEEGQSSKNIAPLAHAELINISAFGGSVYINYDKVLKKGIRITDSNINTKNGFIHVIDDMMPIFTPDPAGVTWELTDFASVAGIAKDYRKKNLKSAATTIFAEGTIPEYKWGTVLPESMYNAVMYRVFPSTDATYNQVVYNDALALNLRNYGWIDIKTPTIVKGKYEVSVFAQSKNKNKNGKFMAYFDGKQIGGEITTHDSKSNTFVARKLGTVTFDSSIEHTFRIMQTDDIEIVLDYIQFNPVK